ESDGFFPKLYLLVLSGLAAQGLYNGPTGIPALALLESRFDRELVEQQYDALGELLDQRITDELRYILEQH
ncbi:hypothetical protein NLA05_21245, partial [Xanthomonas citri pv. anacardii]